MHSGLNPFASQKSDKLPNMTATFHFKSGWWPLRGAAVLSVSFWHLKLKVVEKIGDYNLFTLVKICICFQAKVSHRVWNAQREKIDFVCVNFCHRFLDSLSPVDAILTLGGRYSFPAHMLSHGRKNTSKKNKELILVSILSGKDEIVRFFYFVHFLLVLVLNLLVTMFWFLKSGFLDFFRTIFTAKKYPNVTPNFGFLKYAHWL